MTFFEDYDPYGDGYAPDDPKSPGWADRMLIAVEVMKEKRWENLDPREDPEEASE